MTDVWIVIFALTGATFATRLSGIFLGQRIPREGAWARALNALPGCLIVSLISGALLRTRRGVHDRRLYRLGRAERAAGV